MIRLRADTEPEIYAATQMFGTVLENVVLDPATRAVDFDADTITENTRACYPIDAIPNHLPSGAGGHPKNIVFLAADAFGVMPPIARLSAEQAMYHFLSGYTAKVAGTERGVTEPSATFSACFGAPFLPLHPGVYAAHAGRADRAARGQGLAGEHRLDRRPLRRRHADEARPHPGDGAGGAVRRAGQGQVQSRSGFRIRSSRQGAGRAHRASLSAENLVRSRGVRCPGPEARHDVPGELRAVSGRGSLFGGCRRTSVSREARRRGGGAANARAAPDKDLPVNAAEDDRPAASPPSYTEIIRDPLWDNIRLDRAALLALDTPAVQRLRYVRQVGHSFLVYPGATHTRFEHALGAYHLTRRALAALEELGELPPQLDDDCVAVRMAALLHDIGHYPFSHALEEAGFPSHEALGVASFSRESWASAWSRSVARPFPRR